MRFDAKTKFVAVLALLTVGGAVAAIASAGQGDPQLTPVPSANTRSDGFAPASVLSPELRQVAVAQGSTKLENPSALTSYYGYYNDVVNASGAPQMLPTPTTNTEAQKSEPDKNTYLVFRHGLKGADPSFDYGTHFLFQGHEADVGGASYITRINLDADGPHRVTLLATTDSGGHPIAAIDGSTWEPWARRLLFTTEDSSVPGVYSATPNYPSTVDDLSGSFGHAAYEGLQDDSDGNIWLLEDSSGPFKNGTKAKAPHSFLYRFVPTKRGDLTRGKLQVLQVLRNGTPITEASQTALNTPDQLALHTYGQSFDTRWITIHDTTVDGTAVFSANALAHTANATPFKRPENGLFRPGTGFKEFFFDETGDTDATSPENPHSGGWGSIFKLTQSRPSADSGKLTIFYNGDQAHAGFDNVAWLSKNEVTFVEDAGDGLHGQRNALDSGWAFDATKDYSNPANRPVRWLAEGRDPSATIDAANGGFGKNEGDNEITGAHASDGDPGPGGILGAAIPHPWQGGEDEDDQGEGDGQWRVFYTQQHGDNTTWEVLRAG